MIRKKAGLVLMLSCLLALGCSEGSNGNDENTNPEQQDPDQKDPDQKDPDQKDPDQKDPDQKDPDQKDPDQKDPDQKDPEQKDPDQKDPEQKDPRPDTDKSPGITSLDPTSGKEGTVVTISGRNLSQADKVCFAQTCVSPEETADTSLKVKAPAGTGNAAVTVSVDDKLLVAGFFNYLTESPNKDEVDWCQLNWFEPEIKSGNPIVAYAQVYEAGKTGKTGTHDLKAEFGYMNEMSKDDAMFTWVDAVRNEGFDAEASQNNDEYTINDLKLADGAYAVAFRFSLDGTNWKMCDTNGSDDGFDLTKAAQINVAPEPIVKKQVGWCRIMNDITTYYTKVGESSENIYAQAFVEGCTHYKDHCPDLKAQIGYGLPAQATEDAIDGAFTWTDAKINEGYDGSGGELHDEFMAQVKTDEIGEYAIVYRMSVDDGETWMYCDTADDVAYSPMNAVSWIVNEEGHDPEHPILPPIGDSVEWCRFQGPASATVRANHESETFYGQVYIHGVTGYPYMHAPKNITAELGYGDPTKDPSEFEYVEASLNWGLYPPSVNNEYMATLTPDEPGEYALAYRFSLDDGETWTYCDYDDEDGFDMSKTAKLTVTKDEDAILWCRVQHPQSQTIRLGETTDKYYGQVWVEGCSEGSAKCESVEGQIGYGLKTVEDLEDFTWNEATYNETFTTTNNDEYFATITPTEPGGYDVAYRFTTNHGETWTYCDFDDLGGYVREKSASLIVKDNKLSVSWCRMFADNPIEVTAGGNTELIYAQAYVEDCSEEAGRCTNLTAYVGYGTADDDIKDFHFSEAGFDSDFYQEGNKNDQFKGSFQAPKTAGEYDIAYAFSVDGGETLVYCDTDDNAEFDRSKTGKLVVTEPPKPKELEIGWCQIQWPKSDFSIFDTDEADVYGRVYVEGCTNVKEGCSAKIKAELGYGSKDATDPSTFNYVPASYYPSAIYLGNNEEYAATLSNIPVGDYALAYRFSLDGTNWVYCDNDDDITAFNSADTLKMTVEKPKILTWGDALGNYKCGIDDDYASYTAEPKAIQGIVGSIYIPGCTNDGATCKYVKSASLAYIKDDGTDVNFTVGNKSWMTVDAIESAPLGNNTNYTAKLQLDEGTYYYYFMFGLEDEERSASQTVQCFSHWKSPTDATINDLGVATIEK